MNSESCFTPCRKSDYRLYQIPDPSVGSDIRTYLSIELHVDGAVLHLYQEEAL